MLRHKLHVALVSVHLQHGLELAPALQCHLLGQCQPRTQDFLFRLRQFRQSDPVRDAHLVRRYVHYLIRQSVDADVRQAHLSGLRIGNVHQLAQVARLFQCLLVLVRKCM